MNRSTAVVILGTLAAACGEPSGGGPSGVDASTPAAFDDGIATIEVRGQEFGGGQGSTSITAMLLTTPAPWPYQAAVTDGVCRMWIKQPPDACQPACDFDQICDAGTCVAWPTSASAGTITVAGGGESEAVPFDSGYYQRYAQRVLFPPGTEVTASAPGADFGGFTLAARMPSPLVLEGIDALRLAPGTPLTLRWTPADDDARIRVTLGADYGHGRHRSVVVECDVADRDGGVTVPQPLVDELADPANWSCGDCFSHEVRRYRRGDATVAGTPLTLWAVQYAGLYLVPE